MQIRLSAHGAYCHCYHLIWIPKYRKPILKGEVKTFIEAHLLDIQQYHPEVEIQQSHIREDHLHLVTSIPPKFSVSSIVGKIKANTSRQARKHFPWIKEMYWRNEFWSPGFFSSTVGIDEDVIRKYVEFQEKLDKGQIQLSLKLP